MKTPAHIYPPSPRPYSGLPDVTYPLHDREVVITACGRICMHRKRINVSLVLAGQRVGIEELDEAIWIVSFVHYDLGFVTVSVPVERGQCCEGAAEVRPEPANGGPPERAATGNAG